MAINQWSTNHRLADDAIFYFGDGDDVGLRFNSSNSRLEVVNAGGGVFGYFETGTSRITYPYLTATTRLTFTGIGVRAAGYISITAANSPHTMDGDTHVLAVDCSTGAVTVNLPSAATYARLIYRIKDANGASTSNNITISPTTASQTIDGSTSSVINTAYGVLHLISNGSVWLTL